MESAAMGELKSTLGDCMAADEIEALWLEYENGETNEAKLVKDFDKVIYFSRNSFSAHHLRELLVENQIATWVLIFSYLLLQIEMILQASEYEAAQGNELQEFFDSTAGKWRTDVGRSWAEEICKRRNERNAASK
jgi:putative hydrolase of HD superfamily